MYLQPSLGFTDTIIYLIAAVGPSILLFYYVYKKDTIEKEPMPLIRKLFIIGGLVSAVFALAAELLSEKLMYAYFSNHYITSTKYAIITAISVGLIEEFGKFFILKKLSWKSPAFNYTFDGIVYAVCVSLGFAAVENILYVFVYGGLDIAFQRAILTIPAHMSFAVYMGLFYGRSKVMDKAGFPERRSVFTALSYVSAVLLHSVYDGSLMIGTTGSIIFFYVFVVLLDIAVILTIRRESKMDQRIS